MIDIAAGKLIGKDREVRFAYTADVQLRGELPIAPDVSGIAPNRRDREQLLEPITDWNKAQILTLTHSAS